MTVDPNDLLIFKLRGIQAKPKKESEKEKTGGWLRMPAPAPKPSIEKPSVRAEREIAAMEKKELIEERAAKKIQKKGKKTKEEPTPEESVRLYGYEPEKRLEMMLETQGTEAEIARVRRMHAFTYITGLLFIANAFVFGYFIYSQSVFIINYIYMTGIRSFFTTFNYNYDTSFANLVLASLSMIGGLLMFTKKERGHLFSGFVGSLLILAVTFEYLNSNATYLLIVSVIAFVGIGSLAYARMSAESVKESEELRQEGLDWPRIETF